MKDFFDEVIEIVHGSALTKNQLAKELTDKLPQLKRKSERIKQFLSTYCDRGRDFISTNIGSGNNSKNNKSLKVRQIVNTEKVI